jgi:hypothetical protein
MIKFSKTKTKIFLHSSALLSFAAESFSSGFPDVLLFLLSFVSLLLLLSLLFTVAEVDGPEFNADEDAAGSFLMIVEGGDPSSCLIDVTISCSDEPKEYFMRTDKKYFE